MRYLLLIPAVVAMLAAVFFYACAALFKWPGWTTALLLFGGITFQVVALYVAGLIDR